MHSHFVFAPPGKRAALLTFLLLLPAIASPGAAQPARPAVRGNRQTVQPRRGSQPAKTPETTEAAVQPPPEVPTADAPSAPGTPLVTAGELVPFNVAASKEFRVEAPTGADRLDFNFLIAGTDSLSVYVRYGQSPVDATGKIFAEHTFHEMKAASVGSISRLSSPPLRDGTYYFRLESSGLAHGSFLIVPVHSFKQADAVAAGKTAPPADPVVLDWGVPALGVLVLACLGLVFWQGRKLNQCLLLLRSEERHVPDKKPEHFDEPVGKREIPPEDSRIVPRGQPEEAPQNDRAQSDASDLVRNLDGLLTDEPMLVLARLVRAVAVKAGGSAAETLRRDYSDYLGLLDTLEGMHQEIAQSGSIGGMKRRFVTLQQNIAAVRAKHNPRFFLDVLDEAEVRRMPELAQMTAALSVEAIDPPVGTEVSDVNQFCVTKTVGEGLRSVLDKVVARGYRSKDTGEVYRKPSIVVRLEAARP